jgi:hypothetical protein
VARRATIRGLLAGPSSASTDCTGPALSVRAWLQISGSSRCNPVGPSSTAMSRASLALRLPNGNDRKSAPFSSNRSKAHRNASPSRRRPCSSSKAAMPCLVGFNRTEEAALTEQR